MWNKYIYVAPMKQETEEASNWLLVESWNKVWVIHEFNKLKET